MFATQSRPFFTIVEKAEFEPSAVLRVLHGDLAAVVFRGFCSPDQCSQISRRFLSSPDLRSRTGDAEGRYLGAFHWGKRLEEYFAESATMIPVVEDVLSTADQPSWHRFEDGLRSELDLRGHRLRRAAWSGGHAATPIIRSWHGRGSFSLVPHEDAAQCRDPQQAGFEIQGVPDFESCSANLCIGNEGGGDLVLWDYSPSEPDRVRHGTTHTGGPYPLEALAGVPRLDLAVRTGDLYIFNGSLVHAVAATSGQRATVSTLLGYCNDTDVVMWT